MDGVPSTLKSPLQASKGGAPLILCLQVKHHEVAPELASNNTA